VTATYFYDNPQKDLSSLTYSDGTPTVGHTYDRLGRPATTTTGTFAQLVRTYSPTHLGPATETTTYDTNGSSTFDAPDFTRVLNRQYTDPVMTTRNTGYTTGPSAATAEASAVYGFEPVAGRLGTVTTGSALGTSAFTYGYEPAKPHLIKTLTSPAHLVTNTWEPNRDVLDTKTNTQGATNSSTFDYTVNAVGQRTGVTTTSGGNWVWDYDSLGQVSKADNMGSNDFDRVYLYDNIGNRINAADRVTVIAPGTPPTYTANALNQYTAINAAVPSYDFAGNMTADAGAHSAAIARSYVWDGENRLKEVKSTAVPQTQIAAYRYDAFHRRIAKTLGTNTTWFIYDDWNMIGEYTGAAGSLPVLKKTHHWGLDVSGSIQGAGGVGGLLATDLHSGVSGTGRYFPAYDGNGNIGEYLKTGGIVSARFTYDPFGRPLINTVNTMANQLSFRFSTKYRDPETDFYYYGYRYYSAVLGRWLNRDPIGKAGGLNLYGMVENDSVNKLDFLGLVGSFNVRPEPGMTTANPIELAVLSSAGKTGITSGFRVTFTPDPTSACTPSDVVLVQVINRNSRSQQLRVDSGMTEAQRQNHLKYGTGYLPPYSGITVGNLSYLDAPQDPDNDPGVWKMEVCAFCDKTCAKNLGCTSFTMPNEDTQTLTTPSTRLNYRPISPSGTRPAVGPTTGYTNATTAFLTP
jgi:RHS repeat-associated protein